MENSVDYESQQTTEKCDKETEDCSLDVSIKESLRDQPEVLSFIQRLQECILRQRKLIHNLYAKLKAEQDRQKSQREDAFTQTCEEDFAELQSTLKPEDIVKDIKQAAENAVQQTGFVYESSSGMYYDYNTGYYYNAELGLYYDGHNGIYYFFDEASKSFQFHSQVAQPLNLPLKIPETTPDVQPKNNTRLKRQPEITNTFTESSKKIKSELTSREEGECSESDESEEIVENEEYAKTEVVANHDANENSLDVEDCQMKPNIKERTTHLSEDEIAKAWPPCLRVVVKETGLDNLLVGSLFLVTCTGGSLGREGDHAIHIPDINISKHHAKVSFSETERCYQIVDLGSRNGTWVDGKRISVALRESEPVALPHGTMVKVGSTRLECHVHAGRETCVQCEPGCAQADARLQAGNTEMSKEDHETREARHRSELRRLRKRFGLDKLSAKEATGNLAPGYQDRAEVRRKTVGSLDHNAKTETASVHQSIKNTNKGFKMLAKMGWSEGQGLGKDTSKGITEPVLVEQRPEKAGLGAEGVNLPVADLSVKKKAEIWKKAQKRFQELDDSED